MSSTASKPTPDDGDAIEAAAAAWLVERDEGFTSEQAAEFERWRSADPRHEQAVAQLEETCGLLERMPLVREKLESTSGSPAAAQNENTHEPDTRAHTNVIRFPMLLKLGVAIAACVIVALGIWAARRDRVTFTETYATSVGGYQRVVLPDESVIELNAATELRVQFFESGRRVTLARGEAHFTVAKNPARPFRVNAGGVAVRAVGTAFNVRLDSASVDVLVTEGRVEVTRANLVAPQLVAGQRVVVSTEPGAAFSPQVMNLAPEAVRVALAWQIPRLTFQETPLADVVQQFNRHNRVQLAIDDPELARRPVGGTFRADNVETFVQLLEHAGDIAVNRPDADRIVLRKSQR